MYMHATAMGGREALPSTSRPDRSACLLGEPVHNLRDRCRMPAVDDGVASSEASETLRGQLGGVICSCGLEEHGQGFEMQSFIPVADGTGTLSRRLQLLGPVFMCLLSRMTGGIENNHCTLMLQLKAQSACVLE